MGLLDEEPHVRISGAQAAGCSPVATAFAEGTDAIRPVKPHTIAKSLAIGNPADGWYALDDDPRERRVRSRRSPTTRSSTASACWPGPRGSSPRPPAGSPSPPWPSWPPQGVVRRDERVVAYVTGHGLKTVEALVDTVGPTATIAPTMEAFAAAVDVEGAIEGDR